LKKKTKQNKAKDFLVFINYVINTDYFMFQKMSHETCLCCRQAVYYLCHVV